MQGLRTIGVTQQTVTRRLERAAELGRIEAWMIGAGRTAIRLFTRRGEKLGWGAGGPKGEELGYPPSCWTNRLARRHASEARGVCWHPSLAKLAQGRSGKSWRARGQADTKVTLYLPGKNGSQF